MQRKIYTLAFGPKTLTAEFNDLALQANGSVLLTYGETVIFVTAVMGKSETNLPYFPLSVEFEEKFYAAGEILGSRFSRREGRPSEEAVLSARVVDRTIRPLFSPLLRREIQIVVTVLSLGEDDPDVLAVLGASLALGVSDIPFDGPVAAVRVAQKKDQSDFIINPTYSDRREGSLAIELLACGKNRSINMIEAGAYEVAEEVVVAALSKAQETHTLFETFQKTIAAEIGRTKYILPTPEIPTEFETVFRNSFKQKLSETLFSGQTGKAHILKLKEEFLSVIALSETTYSLVQASPYFDDQVDAALHRGAVEEGKRADGRNFSTVRPLYAEAGGISPLLHGSGIFYRGETRIFSALTLGGPEAAQLIETIEQPSQKKGFMHHYNFPPFSVGETGRVGGFNRRTIGHGALAEKALLPVLPRKEDFPYTIRVVSETMSSNGSSSMGSVCASSLALMDGGVPITRAVAGIASGVMMMGEKYTLLTDIQGPEDEYGDMDFKVAGTTLGITAIQMDVKVSGIPITILTEALAAAKIARMEILQTLTSALPTARAQISPFAPQIITLAILPEQIGLVIGGGGKTIKGIKDSTGVEEITIEDSGQVYITGKNGTAERAASHIRSLTRRYALGERVMVTITKIAAFGAFASLDEHNEGLIHISEVAPFRLETLVGILTVGEKLPVIVSKLDGGKIGLSIKQADPDFATARNIP